MGTKSNPGQFDCHAKAARRTSQCSCFWRAIRLHRIWFVNGRGAKVRGWKTTRKSPRLWSAPIAWRRRGRNDLVKSLRSELAALERELQADARYVKVQRIKELLTAYAPEKELSKAKLVRREIETDGKGNFKLRPGAIELNAQE